MSSMPNPPRDVPPRDVIDPESERPANVPKAFGIGTGKFLPAVIVLIVALAVILYFLFR